MDARLIALKLFLKELGISGDISTRQKRKLLQKAVYLGQQTGVDLGYRFGWYINGPYSPALTRDYYSLTESIASGEDDYRRKKFPRSILERLSKATALLEQPEGLDISEPDWAELIASLHFLKNVGKYSEKEAREIIKKEKPHLIKYVDRALSHIRDNPL